MSFKGRLLKWLGRTVTLSLVAAAIVPDALRVPVSWRPWVFVIALAWLFAFCTGMFDFDTRL